MQSVVDASQYVPLKAHRAGDRMELDGRLALVTGAQQGIGRAIAIAFARAGADVAINYLDDLPAAESVAEAIRAAGRRAVLLQGDVASVVRMRRAGAQTVAELGGIDILVNNAGVFPRVPFLKMTEADWRLRHRRQPEGHLLLLAGGGAGDDRRRPARHDHQPGVAVDHRPLARTARIMPPARAGSCR